MYKQFKSLPGFAGSALTAVLLLSSSNAVANLQDGQDDDKHWDKWQSFSSGYVARRRVPARIELPVVQRRKASTQQRNRRDNTQAMANGAANALWLRTDTAGLHQVSISDLATELGENVVSLRNKARIHKLSLTNAGQPVSWYFDRNTDSILFAAQAYNTFYTDTNAFRFWVDGQMAQTMSVAKRRIPKSAAATKTPFMQTLVFEEEPDMLYSTWTVAAEPEADYWFWDFLHGGYQDEISVPLNIPNPAAAGKAQLRVTLRGWTNIQAGDEHHVIAELNGQQVGAVVDFDGFEEAVLIADFDQGLLNSSDDNTLVLRNRYEAGTHPGQWLDEVEIDYSRLPIAVNGELWMHGVAAGLQTVTGFSDKDIRVIESPEAHATIHKNVRINADGSGGWSVTFKAEAGKDYLLTQLDHVHSAILEPDYPSTLTKSKNKAQHLTIAPSVFAGTADALATYRQGFYKDVKLVLLEDIYDEFSHGLVDPSAIGRFMQAVSAWNEVPSTVTLIGKGTLDEKNRMGYGDSFLPVRMTSTPWSLAVSDSRLLGVEDDSPYAIGRLPIINNEEGMAYVEKLIAYESAVPGNERFAAVVVADNADSAGDFKANSEILAAKLGGMGFRQVSKLYQPEVNVRDGLTDSASWQVAYVSYDGHGSSAQLGDHNENFINATDAALLNNSVYPIFTALTCAAGDDSLPGVRSLAGALVLNPAGGAIASLAPAGLSLDSDAQIFGNAFVDSLFVGNNSIGTAVREAREQTSGSIAGFMPRMYSVVGEPDVSAR